jgi:hypothetical protein
LGAVGSVDINTGELMQQLLWEIVVFISWEKRGLPLISDLPVMSERVVRLEKSNVFRSSGCNVGGL